MVSFRAPALAWTDTSDDERLFRRVTGFIVVGTFALAAVLTLAKAPKEVKTDQQALPAPMAKLLLEHKPAAIVPAQPVAERPVKLAEPVKESPKKERPVDKAPAPEAPRESVSKNNAPSQDVPRSMVTAAPAAVVNEAATQAAAVDAARRKVASLGLLAARDDIAQVRSGAVGAAVKTDIRQAGGGQAATQSDGAALTRSLITTNSSGGSQQVNVPVSNRSVGGGSGGSGGAAGLTTRTTTVVTDELTGRAAAAVAKRAAENAGSKPKRSYEDIRAVLSRHKGALDGIFIRASREDPTLQGRVTFEIKIAPTGEVLSCKVTFSELNAPEVEAKLVARIRMIDFGAKDVDVTIEKLPYDFVPS